MNQEAYDKYLPYVKPNGVVIFDSDFVKPILVEKINQHAVPFTRIADEVGNKLYANSVVLGYLIAVTKLLSKNIVRKVLARNVPKTTVEANLKAFDIGYNRGEWLK